jgi:RNA polymerase sigma factor (TIGR02999 family)
MTPSPQEVTQLLIDWRNGNKTALDQLILLVSQELHRLAKRYMSREDPRHTWQTTAPVNEAYLRLIDQQNIQWQNRAHFFAISAHIMRHLLVDHARCVETPNMGAARTMSCSMYRELTNTVTSDE